METLLIENRRTDYVVYKKEAPTMNGQPIAHLVRFTDNAGSDNEWGQITMHRSGIDDALVIHLTAYQKLNDGDEDKRKLCATLRVSVHDLKTLVAIGERLTGTLGDAARIRQLENKVLELEEDRLQLIKRAKECEESFLKNIIEG